MRGRLQQRQPPAVNTERAHKIQLESSAHRKKTVKTQASKTHLQHLGKKYAFMVHYMKS